MAFPVVVVTDERDGPMHLSGGRNGHKSDDGNVIGGRVGSSGRDVKVLTSKSDGTVVCCGGAWSRSI